MMPQVIDAGACLFAAWFVWRGIESAWERIDDVNEPPVNGRHEPSTTIKETDE